MHNDGRVRSYRDNLTMIVEKIQQATPGTGILLITCPEAGQTREGMARDFAGAAREIAAAHKCACWDWGSLLGPHSRPAEEQGWMGDGLHYNMIGGGAFAHLLLKQLGFDINDLQHWTSLLHTPEPTGRPRIHLPRLPALTVDQVAEALNNEPLYSYWLLDQKAAEAGATTSPCMPA